jgi:hypothetical protein
MNVMLKDSTVVRLDDQDAHFLTWGTWRYHTPKRSNGTSERRGYVELVSIQGGKRKRYALHRVIMGAATGQIVDHIDGDTTNNTRSNLRFVTRRQNARNAAKREKPSASRFKGVTQTPFKGWRPRIWNGEKNVSLGWTQNEVEAAYRYDLASLEVHGEYGRRNFLPLVRQ